MRPRGCLLVVCLFFLFGLQLPAKGLVKDQAKLTDVYGDPLPPGALARLGSVRFHHPGGVIAIAFTPDGKTILAGGFDKDKGNLSLRFWEKATGKEIGRLTPKGSDLRQLIFTPDGKQVLVARQRVAELYDTASGELLRTFDAEHAICSFALSADGSLVAGQPAVWQMDVPIHLWDAVTGKELASFPGRGMGATGLRFSSDGKRLISWSVLPTLSPGGGNIGPENVRLICIWDVATRKKLHETPIANVQVAFAPDAETVAMQMKEGGLRIVNLVTGQERCKIAGANEYFTFSPDGKSLVTSGYYAMPILWDAETGKELRHFEEQPGSQLRPAGFSPDGKTLAMMTGDWRQDGSVLLWDVATGKAIRNHAGHSDEVTCVAVAPGGKLVASGSRDHTIRLWAPDTGQEVVRWDAHKGGVLALAFAPDGKTLASTGTDSLTRLWEMPGGKEIAKFDGPENGPAGFRALGIGNAGALSFSADGKTLVAGGAGGTVHVWELAGPKKSHSFKTGPDGSIFAISAGGGVALSANGEMREDLLAERLRLWSTTTTQAVLDIHLRPLKAEYDHLTCWTAAISGDGRVFANTQSRVSETLRGTMHADHLIRLWERATGQEIVSITGARVHALAFSPDGRMLAAGHGNNYGFHNQKLDSDVSLWDTLTGKLLATFKGHGNQIACVAFSPDGKTLISGSADHTILVWDLSPIRRAQPVADPASAVQLDGWWEDLGAAPAKAYPSLAELVDRPQQAVKTIRDRLKPAPPVDTERIAALLKTLDSPNFKERQKGMTALEEMGDVCETAYRRVLAGNPSLETRRRVELLLGKIETTALPPERLRVLRALAVLEWIGDAPAREALAVLAKGAPEARLTRDAHAALDRLVKGPKAGG